MAPLKVFISYSKHDEELVDRLKIHLYSLKREGKIQLWYDQLIEAGEDWGTEKRQRLATADIILLLISADFIASDYCYAEEMQQAMERLGEARVIPIILRPCEWEHSPFGGLKALPKDGKPITRWNDQDEAFLGIVKELRRVVESVSRKDNKDSLLQNTDITIDEDSGNFDEKQVREHCRQKILDQHSRMRLLNGKELGVDQLYVDVYLLENPERKRFDAPESLLSSFDVKSDRLALSKRIDRNPGFEVANETSKLVILGKPGSGKTTFLKHIAVDWCNGKFQPDFVAILIELRQIRAQSWDFWDAVISELGLNNQHQFLRLKKEVLGLEKEIQDQQGLTASKTAEQRRRLESFKKQLEPLPLQSLLNQGKLLILMDGLDEVPTNDLRRDIQAQLRQASEDYPENRFILTCRTQILDAIPKCFTSVEVADFSLKQVEQFVRNWFKASDQSATEAEEKWRKLNSVIANKPDLKELMVTPVLLSLLCLVFQDTKDVPQDRSWLYGRGIKLLLSRWNNEKQIDDWEVGSDAYRQLSAEEKEVLLIEIAARKFENPENFVLFEQEELARQITRKLGLKNTREGVAVLKAIEAQHGLLIERADQLWSFSHLTFQEHFTVQWLTQLSPEQLGEKIANQQWQKVVRQLVKSQQPADSLLRLIKQAIDKSIGYEPEIQSLLNWLFQKLNSISTNYKPAAIRAFYYVLARARDLELDPDRARARALDLDLDFKIPLARARTLSYAFEFALAYDLARDFARDLDLALDLGHDLDLALDRDLDLAIAPDRPLDRPLELANDLALDRSLTLTLTLARTLALTRPLASNLAQALALALVFTLEGALNCTQMSLLLSKLKQLGAALPKLDNPRSVSQWWQRNGSHWIKQLRQVMIEHRNIGYDWRFNDSQKQQLEQYYDANKYLVDLMKIGGAVSDKARIEIEDGLLLPWEELRQDGG